MLYLGTMMLGNESAIVFSTAVAKGTEITSSQKRYVKKHVTLAPECELVSVYLFMSLVPQANLN